jgi:hypothetical protein
MAGGTAASNVRAAWPSVLRVLRGRSPTRFRPVTGAPPSLPDTESGTPSNRRAHFALSVVGLHRSAGRAGETRRARKRLSSFAESSFSASPPMLLLTRTRAGRLGGGEWQSGITPICASRRAVTAKKPSLASGGRWRALCSQGRCADARDPRRTGQDRLASAFRVEATSRPAQRTAGRSVSFAPGTGNVSCPTCGALNDELEPHCGECAGCSPDAARTDRRGCCAHAGRSTAPCAISAEPSARRRYSLATERFSPPTRREGAFPIGTRGLGCRPSDPTS